MTGRNGEGDGGRAVDRDAMAGIDDHTHNGDQGAHLGEGTGSQADVDGARAPDNGGLSAPPDSEDSRQGVGNATGELGARQKVSYSGEVHGESRGRDSTGGVTNMTDPDGGDDKEKGGVKNSESDNEGWVRVQKRISGGKKLSQHSDAVFEVSSQTSSDIVNNLGRSDKSGLAAGNIGTPGTWVGGSSKETDNTVQRKIEEKLRSQLNKIGGGKGNSEIAHYKIGGTVMRTRADSTSRNKLKNYVEQDDSNRKTIKKRLGV